jgi:FeS assembly SUF system protein
MEEKSFIPSIGGEHNADNRENETPAAEPVAKREMKSLGDTFPRLAEAIAQAEAEKKNVEEQPATNANLRDEIIEAIKTVYDPEIPVNIYELGLIYEVNIGPENKIDVIMTLTSPGCPAAGMLPGDVEEKVRSVPGTGDVTVEVTFEPPWDQSMMTDEAKLELGFM